MSDLNPTAGFPVPAPSLRRWTQPLAHGVSDAIPHIIRLSIALALAYGATIVYGLAAGYALPTATIFFLVPHSDLIARLEAVLPRAVLLGAIVGAGLGWLAQYGLADAARLRRNEMASLRLLRRWGFFLLLMSFVLALSDGGWSGRIASGFGNYGSLAGLIPHSDASIYFVSPVEQMLTGFWNPYASHRPFAAGMRHLTMAAVDFSFVGTLLLQAALIAAALLAATRSMVLWRGLWVGLAFAAFTYILARPFLPTFYTEPLGLIWALLSIAFLAEALRRRSLQFALLALVTLTLAEVTRMGSLFTVPAFALWVAIAFGSTHRRRLRVFAVASACVVAVLLVQRLAAGLYADPAATAGGNFAYTLCGLASGGNWTTCPEKFAPEFRRLATEEDRVSFLFSRAVAAMADDPQIMARSMLDNVGDVVRGTPKFVLSGYSVVAGFSGEGYPHQEWALVLLLPGIFFALRRTPAHGELAFWLLMFASMAASAAIIFADDGWRVMYATWPLMALFFALGFSAPGALRVGSRFRPALSVRAGGLMVAVVVVLVLVTPAGTRLWPGSEMARAAASDRPPVGEQALLSARTLTGFIVIPDGEPLSTRVPTLHAADFVRLVHDTGLERDFGPFLEHTMERLPFAFVTAARIDSPDSQSEQLYVAPVEMLTGDRAKAWRVSLGSRIQNKSIREVTAVHALR
jgi:hypothetical protein